MATFFVVFSVLAFNSSNTVPNILPFVLSSLHSFTVNEQAIEARYFGDYIELHLPIENTSRFYVISSVSLSILDFSDSTLHNMHKKIIIDQGANIENFVIPIKTKIRDLMCHRLRYEIKTKTETILGLVSFSEIIQSCETQLIGPREFYANSQVRYRVIARKSANKAPIEKVMVSLYLIDKDTTWITDGLTDVYGNANLTFIAPDSAGQYRILIKSYSSYGEDKITEWVKVKKGNQIYLISDKPLYQPDQTIFTRALVLSQYHLKPIINQEARIQIYDARNNRVFRFDTKTNGYGVFSADFQLADEINYGTYKIEAIVGNEKQTKTVEVKPYVLPKFRIDFTTDREYYKPGDLVRGVLSADYFFGKSVSKAQVVVKVYKYDIDWTEFAAVAGKTDKDGVFEFTVRLPEHFVGQPFEQGLGRARFDVSIIDGASHEEKISRTVVITKDDMVVVFAPEYNELLPNIKNKIFLITTYPNGKPVRTEITVTSRKGKVDKKHLFSDKLGLAEIDVIPDEKGVIELHIEAHDMSGSSVSVAYQASSSEIPDFIRAVSDKAIYRNGGVAELSIFSSTKKGPVFIDIIRQGQVIGSEIYDLIDGTAEAQIALSSDYYGLIQFNVYIVLPTGQIIRDVRTVFVDPVKDLMISAKPNKKTYEPGEESMVDFYVTDNSRKPVVTCLGISIVDEAVFALSEMQPGLEKVYFMLERKLFKPRYEIHGFEPVDVVRFETEKYNYNTEDIESKERAGKILFSGISNIHLHQIEKKTGAQKKVKVHLKREARNRINSDAIAIAQRLFTIHNEKKAFIRIEDVKKALERMDEPELTDPWGNPYKKLLQGKDWQLSITSAGPDEKFETEDDISSPRMSFLHRIFVDFGDYAHLVGIFDDEPSEYGKVTGTVVDATTGEPLIGADVFIESTELGVATDMHGDFEILHVPQGSYNIASSYIAYSSFTFSDVPIIAGKKTVINFELLPTLIEMQAITAVAERPMIVVSETSTGRAVTTKQLDRLPVTTVSQIGAPSEEPRVRKYFPETFLFEPSLITDKRGKARLAFLLPDNITTWRISITASAKDGRLGSGTSPLLVFKDFFIDLDLPVSVTNGDEISLPVAVYNYLKKTISVKIEITQDQWFQLLDVPIKNMTIEKENVGVVYFRIRAKEFGKHKILVRGYANGSSDAMQKTVTVIPDGIKKQTIVSGRLNKDTEHQVGFPSGTIAKSQKILIRLYPGILSQIVDGLEGLLRMPFGCFEQTISVTYPNVLILDYLRRSDKRKPEVEMKALEYISIGYQRLVSYEVTGGGFSWWGDAPANKLLTAYGLMQFRDMKEVFDIDERIIDRTIRWLVEQQEDDGSWSLDEKYHHREVWGKFKNAEILPTAFITWTLLEAGVRDKKINKAINYIKNSIGAIEEPYALALIANALALYDSKDVYLDMVFSKLMSQKIEANDKVYWSSDVSSITNSRGKYANIETSGLIALALVRSGKFTGVAQKAINYLNTNRHANGGWSTTQGTVFALKAILESPRQIEKTSATVYIVLNGERVESVKITPETSDIMRMIELKEDVELSQNTLRLEMRGKGSLLYDIVSYYYLSWGNVSLPSKPPLAIEHEYDKRKLNKDDIITSNIRITNNSNMNLQMVIVDLGIPPGFDVIETDLANLVSRKIFKKYHVTPRQIIIYYDDISAEQISQFSYQLRAKFPLRAQSGYSRVYDYYNPDVMSHTKPVKIEVE